MAQQTAVEWLVDYIKNLEKYPYKTIQELEEKAKQMERERMIGFHRWMMENDKEENSEKYFHYSDEDMLNEYLKKNA